MINKSHFFVRIPIIKAFGATCALICLILLYITLPKNAPAWNLKILPSQMQPVAQGCVEYQVPRWVGSTMITDVYQIREDRIPLMYLWPSELDYKPLPGTFHFVSGPPRLVFHSSDGSDPQVNQKTYEFEFPILSQKRSFCLALFWGGLAFLIFSYSWLVRLPRSWTWYLIAAGLFKLWMVADSEIVISMLDDAKNYSMLVIGNVWDTHDLIAHPGGFPAMAWIAAQLGIPWRLFLELIFICSSGVFAIVAANFLKSKLVAACIYTAMIFNPWTFSGFEDFMPVPALLVITILLWATILSILNKAPTSWRIPPFIAVGILFSLWNWIRIEDPLVYASYAVVCLGLLLVWYFSLQRISLLRILGLFCIPLVMLVLSTTFLKAANYVNFGVYSKSQIDMPGLLALLKTLYQVDTEKKIPYSPVTRESLSKAIDQSPTLQPFKDKLLDREFGSGLNWQLKRQIPGTVKQKNALMLKAANEIEEALVTGKLSRGQDSFPLNPHWDLWMPRLPASFAKVCGYLFANQAWQTNPKDVPDLNNLFDHSASRRSGVELSDEYQKGEGIFTVNGRKNRFEKIVESFYGKIVFIFCLISICIGLKQPAWSVQKIWILFTAIVIFAAFLVGRVGLYAIFLENLGLPVSRYVLPFSVLFYPSTLMVSFFLSMAIKYFLIRKKNLKRES